MKIITTTLALLLCAAVAADEIDNGSQWRELMKEAREARSSGDPETAAEKALLAAALAEDVSRVAVAESLDLIGKSLAAEGDPTGALDVLERARSIKEDELGPRDPAVADTLLIMASIVNARDIAADPEGDPASIVSGALALYREALDIRREAFGESSCMVAEVRVSVGAGHEALGKLDKAERIYREVLTYCPSRGGNGSDPDPGFAAQSMLLGLLLEQGREDEVAELERERDALHTFQPPGAP